MKFSIMDHTGHSTIEFARDGAGVRAAMDKFAALIADGKTAATRQVGSSEYNVTRSFDPESEETLFIPRLQGG